VRHLLSLATSITADAADPTTTTPADRTGWGGDGGSLHDFLNSAIKQHYTKALDRVAGVDFRFARRRSSTVEQFQARARPLNELDLAQVNLFDALPRRQGGLSRSDAGRCQVWPRQCGANFEASGKNRQLRYRHAARTECRLHNPRVRRAWHCSTAASAGKDLAAPNVVTLPLDPPVNNGFGNNTFNTTTVIERRTPLPSFHTKTSAGASDGSPDHRGCRHGSMPACFWNHGRPMI